MTNHFNENEGQEENSVSSFVSDDLSDDVASSLDVDSASKDRVDGIGTDELKLARTESQYVLCSKFLAYLVLFLSAVVAGFAAYYLTRSQENLDFEHDVRGEKPV